LMLLGLDHYLKIIFVSENKVQLSLYSMLSQMLCSWDIEIIKGVFCNKLDPSASPDGTSSKVIFTCKGSQGQPVTEVKENEINIIRCGKKLHIGHELDKTAQINLIVDSDIDPKNEDDVLWAMATRLQPANGIKISDNSMTIDTRRPGLSRPRLPEEVIKNVIQYLQKVQVLS